MRLKFKRCQSTVLRAVAKTRYVVLVAGRRFGKTYLSVTSLIMSATRQRNRKVWYIAPTYKQAKEITWDILKESVPRQWIKNANETELAVTLLNGSRIALKGADNADSLRGPGLNRLVIDEASDIKNLQNVWEAIIGPTLTTTQGEALFIGTPRGYDYFHDLYMSAISTANIDSAQWQGYQYTSLQGGYIPEEEIRLKKATIDPRIFRQEYEACFETLSGRVYYQFDHRKNVDESLADVGGDILIGIDFNVDPMSAVIGVRAGRELHILEEIIIPNSNTQELTTRIKATYGNRVVDDPNYQLLKDLGEAGSIPVRAVRTFPDPSGCARKTSASSGITDHVILRNAGFSVTAPRKAPGVMDRLNTVNALLCNANGQRRLMVHPRCKTLIRCLDGLTYKSGTNEPDKTLGLDHLPDALGYLVWSEFPVLVPQVLTGALRG